MIALVRNKVEWLHTLSFDELLALPSFSTEEIQIEERGKEKTIKLTVWHDTLDGGEHRFVVQAVDDSGAFGYAAADGFAQGVAGGRRSLTGEELTEFT